MDSTAPRIAYRAGRCARCGQPIEHGTSEREVLLQVIGPAGTVTIYCWLDATCQPDPASLANFSRELALQLVDWYRANPSTWPAMVTHTRA
jgi:hypothetical protein